MILELQGKCQNYAWGKLGGTSKVAILGLKNGLQIVEETPYAELWIGTHPNGPSIVHPVTAAKNSDFSLKPLKDILSRKIVGDKVWEKFDQDLPFLLKVLSIQKALSIQAHPDKVLGAILHAKFPSLYKDPNHKPEMAIALTPFEALIGFRPLEEIAQNIQTYPEFKAILEKEGQEFCSVVGKSHVDIVTLKSHLKSIFSKLQNTPQPAITDAIQALTSRLKTTKIPSSEPLSTLDSLLLCLDSQFPNDVGVFCALMLNYVFLEAGDAIFLAANEPHAYLSGGMMYKLIADSFQDCVECMAASDNVVRSGLTPKFKDVPTLIEMLTYKFGTAESQILKGSSYKHSTPFTREYNPPIDEFSILQTILSIPGQEEVVDGIDGPSILICVDGKGTISEVDDDESSISCETGSIVFISAGAKTKLTCSSTAFTVYRAFCLVN